MAPCIEPSSVGSEHLLHSQEKHLKLDHTLKPRYLNYVGRTDCALVLPLISRDLTPCMAETALAMVNI